MIDYRSCQDLHHVRELDCEMGILAVASAISLTISTAFAPYFILKNLRLPLNLVVSGMTLLTSVPECIFAIPRVTVSLASI